MSTPLARTEKGAGQEEDEEGGEGGEEGVILSFSYRGVLRVIPADTKRLATKGHWGQ